MAGQLAAETKKGHPPHRAGEGAGGEVRPKEATMLISEVRCFQVSGRTELPSNEERQSQMLDIYPEYGARGVAQRAANGVIKATYVEVVTDEGVGGLIGPILEEQVPLI